MIKTRLIRLLSHSKKFIFYQVAWQWVALICQIAVVYKIAHLAQWLYLGQMTSGRLTSAIVVILVAVVVRFLADRMATKASFAASADVKRILREKMYEKLLRLGSSYRDQVKTAELVQMAAEGVEQLEIYFGKYLSQLIYSLLAPITLFIILFRVNWQSVVVLLICVPLIPVSIVVVQKIAKRLLNKYWGIYTELGDSFLENLQGLTTLKIFQADDRAAKEMDVEAEHFRNITMKVLTMQLNSTSVMDIVAYGGAAVGMAVALLQYTKGNVTLSGTLMILLLASEFFLPLRLLGSFFHIAMNGMAASDKMFAFLDLPEAEGKTEDITGDAFAVDFKQVHFAYEPDREILGGIDLELKNGTFTSIVGVSGSGKSTIAGLLMGRNAGYEGNIVITDANQTAELSTIREESLMNHITMVSHNSYIFKGTVRDNLLMGNPDATKEQMKEALAKVNLLAFLETQNGLDTVLTEQGSNLSGGQRQRLALARALLHDTPMYIFDEATSNIDMESEELIMNVIHQLAKTKTILLISHRLANVTASDMIYLLEDGRIKEQGRHGELMERNGSYAKLYDEQQRLEKGGEWHGEN